MNALDRRQQLDLVAEAARAPSAHNTQPARWQFLPGGDVLLYEDTTRRLTVADPTGRDQRIGLGAALEGLSLALSRAGLALTVRDTGMAGAPPPGRTNLRVVARCEIQSGGPSDILADSVSRRATYRGRFLPLDASTRAALEDAITASTDAIPVMGETAIVALAKLSDRISFGLLARRDYQTELREWMRFSRSDADWARDGLTADCLGLNGSERVVGRWLFAPPRFAVLARLGLHRALVAEASRTRTASALAIFHRPTGEPGLETGRRFYRFWLEMTRAGLHARPMSALADDPGAVAQLRADWGVPAASDVINVFAIGKAPATWSCTSPRLAPEELLLGGADPS